MEENIPFMVFRCPMCSYTTLDAATVLCPRDGALLMVMQEPRKWTAEEIANANEQLESGLCLCNLEQGRLSALEPFEIDQVKRYLTMRELYENNWPEYSQVRGQM